MHDTGGWYIETYGRDKKGKTIPSQRHWDGFNEHSERWGSQVFYCLKLACLVDIFACSAAVHKVRNVVINSKFQSGIAGDCIQLCILSLLLTDLWILKMLEEDNGTWVTSYNCHCLTFFSCSKELLMAMGRRRELTWGHHENRLFENHYLALPTCLKLWCQCHPFFCFILLSLKQLFDNEAP